MYAPFFGLTQAPFSIAPDPRYLFMSERHREALAHLLYGVGGPQGNAGAGGGFVLLSGGIGTGKTTICRCFLDQLPAHCSVAYIFNPKLTVPELMQSVCEEFHIALPPAEAPRSIKQYLDPLNAFLLREHGSGRNCVLVIDEAQNLSAEVLEQLRLLTNLETRERKLLQVILIGQPELRDMIASPALEQLAQRVVARYHLEALSEAETAHYVRHRLEVAGLAGALPFDARSLRRVHALTGGVPRRINLVCDRVLLGAFAQGKPRVSAAMVERAAQEVFYRRPERAMGSLHKAAGVAAVIAGGGAVLWAAAQLIPVTASRLAVTPATAPAGVAAGDTGLTGTAAPLALAGAPVAPSAPPPAPLPPALLYDESAAWRELARYWNVEPGEGPACTALAREQLFCFSRNLGVAQIRQLGRPGVVTLDRDSARPAYAVLAALTEDTATLRAAGSEQTVTLAALAARWKGDFSTLWRAPAGYAGRSGDAERGPVVQWATTQLAAALGTAAPPARTGADARLQSMIRTFQVTQSLPVDGRLNPMTFMQLNRTAGVDEPRLRTEP